MGRTDAAEAVDGDGKDHVVDLKPVQKPDAEVVDDAADDADDDRCPGLNCAAFAPNNQSKRGRALRCIAHQRSRGR